MAGDRVRVVVISFSILAVALTGCARRPGLSQASVAPPTGVAVGSGLLAESRTVVVATESADASPGNPQAQVPTVVRAERPSPRTFEATAALRMIHFDFDRSDIRPGDAMILDANARWLSANPRLLVLIEGHADERGTNEYNLALGERRAQATRTYLLSRGIQANRMNVISYGEEWPICTAHTDACWSQNRRAQFLVKPGE